MMQLLESLVIISHLKCDLGQCLLTILTWIPLVVSDVILHHFP